MQSHFNIFEFSCVIDNLLWLFHLRFASDKTRTKEKKSKKKRKRKAKDEEIVEDNFNVDLQDSRFDALFTSHHFAVDPSDPQYR